mmetsp:Transcript_112205/g.298210  ORF Transcript_112205/g.298210 Transcript_112205/m.298210 type:complete len:268 (+) Transcript_112205:1268-2071(+)
MRLLRPSDPAPRVDVGHPPGQPADGPRQGDGGIGLRRARLADGRAPLQRPLAGARGAVRAALRRLHAGRRPPRRAGALPAHDLEEPGLREAQEGQLQAGLDAEVHHAQGQQRLPVREAVHRRARCGVLAGLERAREGAARPEVPRRAERAGQGPPQPPHALGALAERRARARHQGPRRQAELRHLHPARHAVALQPQEVGAGHREAGLAGGLLGGPPGRQLLAEVVGRPGGQRFHDNGLRGQPPGRSHRRGRQMRRLRSLAHRRPHA